jgi:predicted nucleic acid-binding protein
VDTSVFIYALERKSPFALAAEAVLHAVIEGHPTAAISKLVLAELLVVPYRAQRPDVASKYVHYLESYPNLTLVAPGVEICRTAARLRGEVSALKLPDAIHLATAVASGATAFVTNDARLPAAKDLPVLLLSDLASG